MEDNRENQPFEQASGLASQAAHTVMGALKAGKQACGMAAGTAAGERGRSSPDKGTDSGAGKGRSGCLFADV